MKYCADTWFILQAFEKNKSALDILQEMRHGKTKLIISIIVFAEATKKLMQKGIPASLITQFFDAVEASEKTELVLMDKLIAAEAARISLSYQIPLIDSVVASTSKLTGCDALLSGDSDYQPLVKKKYIVVKSW